MIETPARGVYAARTDVLASDPTTDALLTYKLPDDLQERLAELLERNRDAYLNYDEQLELNDLIRADNMMSLPKTKTRLKQQSLD